MITHKNTMLLLLPNFMACACRYYLLNPSEGTDESFVHWGRNMHNLGILLDTNKQARYHELFEAIWRGDADYVEHATMQGTLKYARGRCWIWGKHCCCADKSFAQVRKRIASSSAFKIHMGRQHLRWQF